MDETGHTILDLRQGKISHRSCGEACLPGPDAVESESDRLGPIRLTACLACGKVFARQIDGFSISTSELRRAGYHAEAQAYDDEHMCKAVRVKINRLKKELVRLESFDQRYNGCNGEEKST
jgi:hypothetical protein